MDYMDWSPRARHMHKASISAHKSKASRHEAGPFLRGDTLIIPSEYFSKKAATFWRNQGFSYDGELRQWSRSTRLPLNGRSWAAEKWLQAARQRYDQFYPLREPREETK